MTKKEIKDLEDANASGFKVLRHVIQSTEEPIDILKPPSAIPLPIEVVKNPAAVALGRLGASKGGKVRAKSLTSVRRKEIAALAAKRRWSKK
jgi:hypothetical protein